MEDPFELRMPRKYRPDLAAVEKTHCDLSRELHPDRFRSRSALKANEAPGRLDKAAKVNEAWRIVRDPICRAALRARRHRGRRDERDEHHLGAASSLAWR